MGGVGVLPFCFYVSLIFRKDSSYSLVTCGIYWKRVIVRGLLGIGAGFSMVYHFVCFGLPDSVGLDESVFYGIVGNGIGSSAQWRF